MKDRKKIGSFAKVRRGASPRPIGDPKYFGGEVGWIRISDVTASNKYLRKTEQYVSPLGESLSVRVDKGDLIMSICATIGRPVIIDFPSCIHDGFVLLYDLKNADTEYLYYILQFHEKDLEAKGQPGTQVNLNTSIVENFEIFIPEDKREQRKIAHILSTCDAVIEKTQNAIDKYKAIKLGMLHDLFTRGIDIKTGKLRPKYEDAPELYKESKLGWVPKDWADDELSKYLSFISYGFTNPMPETNEGPYLITAANVNGGRIQYETCRKTSKDAFDNLLTDKSKPKINDVLLTKDGTLGRIAIVEEENLCINQSVAVLRPNKLIDPLFLKILLESPSYQKTMIDEAGGSTIKHIYITIIDKMPIAVPKEIDEQNEIALRLKTIENKIQTEQNYLHKLQQIKAGLMGDLLTGKKPVIIEKEKMIES
jgi:type I restriction enzyme S subunit